MKRTTEDDGDARIKNCRRDRMDANAHHGPFGATTV